MKYLLDTNVFLSILLDEEKAVESRSLLLKSSIHEFYISDFSLHSIGIILFRSGLHEAFVSFVRDVIQDAGIRVISVPYSDATSISEASRKFSLDFDDAYHYAACSRVGGDIVSFDGDFDRTDRGRQTPVQVLRRKS